MLSAAETETWLSGKDKIQFGLVGPPDASTKLQWSHCHSKDLGFEYVPGFAKGDRLHLQPPVEKVPKSEDHVKNTLKHTPTGDAEKNTWDWKTMEVGVMAFTADWNCRTINKWSFWDLGCDADVNWGIGVMGCEAAQSCHNLSPKY